MQIEIFDNEIATLLDSTDPVLGPLGARIKAIQDVQASFALKAKVSAAVDTGLVSEIMAAIGASSAPEMVALQVKLDALNAPPVVVPEAVQPTINATPTPAPAESVPTETP